MRGGAPEWGVTALQAIEEMDAGPIWATRTFPIDAVPPRKSHLYNHQVADAAPELVREVIAKAANPGFAPQCVDDWGFGTSRPHQRPDRVWGPVPNEMCGVNARWLPKRSGS